MYSAAGTMLASSASAVAPAPASPLRLSQFTSIHGGVRLQPSGRFHALRLGFREDLREQRTRVWRLWTSAAPRLVASIGQYGGCESDDDVVRGVRELQDEADFAVVANDDGEISICGFGSLLSVRSALSTFPNLRNFRVGVLRDFRRVFAHVAPVFLDRGIANIETEELSSLSVEPCVGESIVVTVFEISVAEVPAFIEREHEFRFLAVAVEDKVGQPFSQRAVVCARYSDEEYRRIRCKGSSEEYHKRYGKHNIQQIWRDDIFPCRVYLRHCVLAAKNLGSDAYDSFLDHTYLGDRTTTIRKYFEAGLGVGVMDEEPPAALRDRYGG
ncbi:hypothetical protein KC19_3G240500 [Ceratodon purpureus]|uniref:Uncharacterized protein n=1 Tax=Ceratodon purpureus TaxID=3225 RepID=A0A8T0IM63_CERPU|nr:hypothetical protein KC19_3G240500 [Ceratodon purpureus]